MARLIIPVTVVTNADPGVYDATQATVNTTALDKGWYILAAIGVALQFKTGSTDVLVNGTTGKFLAAGDQEIVEVLADATNLSYIRELSESGDGRINICKINLALGGGVEPANTMN